MLTTPIFHPSSLKAVAFNMVALIIFVIQMIMEIALSPDENNGTDICSNSIVLLNEDVS